MNERKQHVINMAHQLFIDKGYQATSIQDILDYSGISKGTFYNYFTSKNELLIAIFKTISRKIAKERNDLLIGQDPANINIFIKQLELQLYQHRKNNLMVLFEEITVTSDPELTEFFKKRQLMMLDWVYSRFLDIFGESKKSCLLDCAIMFIGILHQNLKYYYMAHETNARISRVVHYSVDRIVKIVEEAVSSGDQLIQPEFLDKWVPVCNNNGQTFKQSLYREISRMKKNLAINGDHARYAELLDFILDELLHTKNPRKFLINTVVSSLKQGQTSIGENELRNLEQLIADYFSQLEQTEAGN